MTSSVLFVGLVCIDNVLTVTQYPEEDSDLPGMGQLRTRGGNASNNCSVASQFGLDSVEFLGNLATEPKNLTDLVRNDFEKKKIKIDHCPVIKGATWPEATVISSLKTGSRTIIYNENDLPELSITAFRESADLTKYNWIHFEGRPTMTTFDLVRFVNEERLVRGLRFTVSVEIEKADHGLEALLPLADLVFVSKDFSKFSGAQSSKEAVGILKNRIAKGSSLICTWGENGCSGYDGRNDVTFDVAAHKPTTSVVDTLGAGDTFTATLIATSLKYPSLTLQTSAKIASFVAGEKVGRVGFDDLATFFRDAVDKNVVSNDVGFDVQCDATK